ncbi:MAG TPA: CYTH domain-containing protein [Cytophagaceae bacterium]|jgi:adenylate cyclase|nr:CYTH domain-containing protein [Cytophagaceae bacterium]
MPEEIERKFLVKKEIWLKAAKPIPDFYRQGYLYSDVSKTIRIRVTNTTAFLTIKGRTIGFSRPEFEYEIPQKEGVEILNIMTENNLEKYRYNIYFEGKLWEVDEFKGENEGLLLAEIELTSADETFTLPDWIGEEVTQDNRYYNAYLSRHPFLKW